MRLSERSRVVFPHPDAPMSAVTVFGRTAMETLFTARVAS